MSNEFLEGADFIDFGCSKGGSLKFAQARFGGAKGVGVDIDPAKVEIARAVGANAIVADASRLELPSSSVRYCTMVHFLEHLPGLTVAGKCIKSAVRIARDFVYIRHPWFNSDYDLYKLGLKFYWSDWHGHTSNIGIAQLDYLIRATQAEEWVFYGMYPVTDLNSPYIVTLDTPCDSQEVPNDRPSVPLPFQAFRDTAVLIRTGSNEAFAEAKAALERDHTLLKVETRKAKSSAPIAVAAEQPASVDETQA